MIFRAFYQYHTIFIKQRNISIINLYQKIVYIRTNNYYARTSDRTRTKHAGNNSQS